MPNLATLLNIAESLALVPATERPEAVDFLLEEHGLTREEAAALVGELRNLLP